MSTLIRPILVFLHLVYSVYLFILRKWALVRRQLLNLGVLQNFSELDARRSQSAKLPGHLVIVVGSEDIAFFDLAKIISWCVTLGIPHVSFYDQKGVIRRNSSQLRRDFESLGPHLASKVTWEVEKITPKASLANGHNGINGFTTTKIHFLSYCNGKHEIIELTKELSHAVAQGLLETSEIDINLIDEKLAYNFPDPDLAIVCGKTFSTFGMLPWHIRVTEFIHVSTHHNMCQDDFMEAIVRYGNCQQRYGK